MYGNERAIGDLIKKLREEQGITLSKLCSGLCSVATMTRVENDERDMELLLAIRIFQRLGINPDKFELYGTEDEFEQYDMRITILRLIKEGSYDRALKEMQKYEERFNKAIKDSQLQQQFVISISGRLAIYEGSTENGIELIKKAITITVPDFDKKWTRSAIVGEDELELFDYLADAYEIIDNKAESFKVRNAIIDYIDERRLRKVQLIKLYTEVICKLAPDLIKSLEYEKCLYLCRHGLEVLAIKRRLFHLPELLYWQGKCLEYYYQIGIINKQHVITVFKKTYYMYDLLGEQKMAGEMWEYLKERYGWECIR